jgi:hypothetical protein
MPGPTVVLQRCELGRLGLVVEACAQDVLHVRRARAVITPRITPPGRRSMNVHVVIIRHSSTLVNHSSSRARGVG